MWDWHQSGETWRMEELLRDGLDYPPEMADVCREALADALAGDRTRLRNRMPADVELTLLWRQMTSYRIKQEMKANKPRLLRGESINEKVADAVNKEWKEGKPEWRLPCDVDEWREDGVILWRLPFSEKHKATARTVADDSRMFPRVLRSLRQ